MAYYCGMETVNGMKNWENRSTKENIARNAFKTLDGLHLPSSLQKACAHMTLMDATIRSTQAHIDMLITEICVTFHFDQTNNKDFVKQTAGMRQFRSYGA